MLRLALGFLLAWGATTAPAATVTVLDQSFYVTVTARTFGSAWVVQDGDLRRFDEADGMTWAELGMPGQGPELGVRYLVEVLITADESLRYDLFALSCNLNYVCDTNSFTHGYPVGDMIRILGGGSTGFDMLINNRGGTSFYANDAHDGGLLPDGRIWFYEGGVDIHATFTPVPLPAGAPLLAGALALMVWRGSRQPGSSAPRLSPVAGRCVPMKSS